jgi:hypothetical protein
MMRPITAIIIILLPLAHRLDLTALLSIIMALIVLCLVWENVTSLRRDARFWESWTDTEYPDSNRGICVPRVGEHEAEIVGKSVRHDDSSMRRMS